MATVLRTSAAVLVAWVTLSFGQLSQHPTDCGETMARNAIGNQYEGAYDNPALLGVDNKEPRGGLSIAPFGDYGVGYWSDKLDLKPYRAFFGIGPESLGVWKSIVEQMLTESFNLGSDPEQNSKKLASGLKDGVTFYAGSRATLLSFNLKRFAVDVTTRMDLQLDLPEGLFYMLLDNVGLIQGNTLDLTHFGADFLWRTDVRLSFGLPMKIPALNRFFHLQYAAGGVAIKYVMGHSMLHIETPTGKLTYTNNNGYDVDAKVNVQTAGLGLHGAWDMYDNGPFQSGLPVAGHGIGIDAGGILYNDNAALTINLRDLGVLFWLNDTRTVTYQIKKSNVNAYDIWQGIDDAQKKYGKDSVKANPDLVLLQIFDRNKGEYISDSRDTLTSSPGFTTVLPLALEIGYGRTWDFSHCKHKGIKFLFKDIDVGINYQQELTNDAGQSYVPRFTLGSEFGTLCNYVPLRIGTILGGPEKYGSTLGAGLNFKYFTINVAYKAIGDVYFVPKRGMELAAGLKFNWGLRPKTAPMPIDTVKDHDHDGIPDSLDKCPNVPEDKDGFEDQDGCPDFDNDKDGIPDSLDKCPNLAEDYDNYQDQDGCPEYDNDGDGIPDSLDKCPNQPEDYDNFQDQDGCPDYDNDNDGIPDSLDKCPNQPETFNGYQDDDGCPDSLPKPTVTEQKVLYKKLQAVNFKTASAELTQESFANLNFVADFLKKYSYLVYEVEGHTDSQGGDEYNLLLSAARAASVRGYLLSKGIPDSSLIFMGYGKTRPIADNATAKGRALNRRVEFKVVETKEENDQLKAESAVFKQRIEGAKIKGAGKYGW